LTSEGEKFCPVRRLPAEKREFIYIYLAKAIVAADEEKKSAQCSYGERHEISFSHQRLLCS
jgi:hypothetical protein